MGESAEQPAPLRKYDELSLPERVTALLATAKELPPRNLLLEWVGTPKDVKPEEVGAKVDEQMARLKQDQETNGLKPKEEVLKGLGVDPKTVHGRIAQVALDKIKRK